jgi:hypothetical protein
VREQKAAYMWRTWGHQREPSCPGEEVTSADDRYFSTMLNHWLTVNDGMLFGLFSPIYDSEGITIKET